MRLDERFESALRSPDPLAELTSLVRHLIALGERPDTVLSLFETARQQLRSEDREAAEDVVMDVMDFLVGWCCPEMAISAESSRPSNGSSLNGGESTPAHELKHAD